MEANEQTSAAPPEASQETQGPTAKQMAAAEEANALRHAKLIAQQQEALPVPPAPVSLHEATSGGYDSLHEQFRRHNELNKPKEYVPPPRTERQMSALREEMEAGARRVAAAEAQKVAAVAKKADLNKEGFTTPVYRPNDVVPDPVRGGMKGFGPDA